MTRGPCPNLNQQGYSLVEVLIAAGMLAGLAIVASQIPVIYQYRPSAMARACKAHAQAVVQAVQEEGAYGQVINFLPYTTGGVRSQVPPTPTYPSVFSPFDLNEPSTVPTRLRALPDAVTQAYLWAGPASNYTITADSGAQATGTNLENAQLIQGELRTLQSIYNNVPAVACQYGSYYPLTTVSTTASATNMVPMGIEFYNTSAAHPTVTIQLSPYDQLTNTNFCPAAPLMLVPGAANPTSANPAAAPTIANISAFAPGSGLLATASYESYSTTTGTQPAAIAANARIATLPTGFTSTTGIELAVHIAYTENGQPQGCDYVQKFEYSVDRTPPPPPDNIRITTNSSSASNVCAGATNATTATATVTIGYTNAVTNVERGVQFLCRDLSWSLNWVPGGAPPQGYYSNYPPCISGGSIQPVIPQPLPSEVAAKSTHFWPLMTANVDPTKQSFDRVDRWVPCDLLTQCGHTNFPTSVSISPAANPNLTPNGAPNPGTFYTLNYANLNQSCVMNFEVVAVDTAGNTSSVGSSPSAGQFLSSFNPISNNTSGWGVSVYNGTTSQIILPPTCSGSWSGGPNALWPVAERFQFPLGYYSCRPGGRCVGPACTPYN